MSTSRTTGGAGTAPEGALRGPDPPERSSVVTVPRLEGFGQGDGTGDRLPAPDRARDEHLVRRVQSVEVDRLDRHLGAPQQLGPGDAREDAPVRRRRDEPVALDDEHVAAAR